jgi:hypothetical protein
MLKNIDNQATDGEEKSKPEVIKLGLDLNVQHQDSILFLSIDGRTKGERDDQP